MTEPTAAKPATTPRSMSRTAPEPVPAPAFPETMNESLAAFQRNLPSITKSAVNSHFQNNYADLADVAREVLPALGAVGLSWVTRPTLVDGSFVLHYELRHWKAEEIIEGDFPLPDQGNSQALGSAITYARRYTLAAVTGVAADEDDDCNAASAAPPAQQSRGRGRQQDAPPANRPPVDADPAWGEQISSATDFPGLNTIYVEAERDGVLDHLLPGGKSIRATLFERRTTIETEATPPDTDRPAALDGMDEGAGQ